MIILTLETLYVIYIYRMTLQEEEHTKTNPGKLDPGEIVHVKAPNAPGEDWSAGYYHNAEIDDSGLEKEQKFGKYGDVTHKFKVDLKQGKTGNTGKTFHVPLWAVKRRRNI